MELIYKKIVTKADVLNERDLVQLALFQDGDLVPKIYSRPFPRKTSIDIIKAEVEAKGAKVIAVIPCDPHNIVTLVSEKLLNPPA